VITDCDALRVISQRPLLRLQEEYCFLECDVVLSDLSWLAFLRHVTNSYTRLHGVISQTTVHFIVTATKTSDLAINIICILGEKQLSDKYRRTIVSYCNSCLSGHRSLKSFRGWLQPQCHWRSSDSLFRCGAQPMTPHKSAGVGLHSHGNTEWCHWLSR
jgi:hypothetical protein